MWIYGKLRLKAWHKAISTTLEYYQVAHQSKKIGVEYFPPAQDMQCRAIVFKLAVRLKTGLGAKGQLVHRFYWLANWSHVFRGLDPIKEDPEKRIDRLKAGSEDRRLEDLATLFATSTALPRVLNLTVPSNINLFKTDSRLTVIASQLIPVLLLL